MMYIEYTPQKALVQLALLLLTVTLVCKNSHRGTRTDRPTPCSGLFILFFMCPRVISSATDSGVGFSLALDYGTASVWYANGAAVDIVKIEGGPSYQQTMRSISAEPELTMSNSEWGQQKLGVMSFQDYLPTWITSKPVDYDADAITWMIKGLKAATEVYMEESMAAVRISNPVSTSHKSLFDGTVRTVVESLGLKYMGTRMESTAITAIYGLEGECDLDVFKTPDQKTRPDDPERIYLAVDYSRAGISAFLVSEDCGVTEILREFYNTGLGTDADSAGKRDDVSRGLKDLTRLPFDEGHYTHAPEISELVLLGESSEDAMLQEILQEVLDNKYIDLKAGSDKRGEMHHPLFAGSRAVAMQSQEQQEYESTRIWDEDLRGWIDKDIWNEEQKWWWSRIGM